MRSNRLEQPQADDTSSPWRPSTGIAGPSSQGQTRRGAPIVRLLVRPLAGEGRSPKRRLVRERPELLAVPGTINQVWSMDLMHD